MNKLHMLSQKTLINWDLIGSFIHGTTELQSLKDCSSSTILKMAANGSTIEKQMSKDKPQ